MNENENFSLLIINSENVLPFIDIENGYSAFPFWKRKADFTKKLFIFLS